MVKKSWGLKCSLFITIAVFAAGFSVPETASAAISVGDSQTNDSSTKSLTINKPGGTAVGDLLIAHLHQKQSGYGNTPTSDGWTLAKTWFFTTGNDQRGTVLYKVVGASEPSSYTFTTTGGTDPFWIFAGVITAFSGVDVTTPFDVIGDADPKLQSPITLPGITTTTSNAMVLFLSQNQGRPGTPQSEFNASLINLPNAATAGDFDAEIYDQFFTVGVGGISREVVISAARLTLVTPGATGDATATYESSTRTRQSGGFLLALREACTTADDCQDGGECQTATCQFGTCVYTDDAATNCLDTGTDACLDPSCDGSNNCLYTPVDANCDDSNPCSVGTCESDGSCTQEPFDGGPECCNPAEPICEEGLICNPDNFTCEAPIIDGAKPVPTLDQWGLGMLGMLMLTAGAWFVARRRKNA
jgi:hypothetical protein